MIFGILDISPTYPYIAVIGIVLIPFMLWLLLRGVARTASILNDMAGQFGKNGDSTLRDELTGMHNRVTDVQKLLSEKLEFNQQAVTKLQSLVDILDHTMGKLGLDQQIRTLLQAYVQKDLANINVIQGGAGSQMGQAAAGAGMEQTKTDVHVETIKPVQSGVAQAQEGVSKTQAGVEQIQQGIDKLKDETK